MKMEPDPKLQEAMEEIKATLKKHDICACVLLSSPGAMEHLTEVDASWTCARFNPKTGELRINSKELPPERKKQVLTDTVGMIYGFMDGMRFFARNLAAVAGALAGRMEIEHTTVELPHGAKERRVRK